MATTKLNHNMEHVRDIAIGVTGFVASVTLDSVTKVGSALAGFATGIYMICRIYDWVVKKNSKKPRRKL